ncbi:MAG: TolC family protein [Lewinellaceae bacterium]|nr:TolC family protein [Lewinellaceae bacterium]
MTDVLRVDVVKDDIQTNLEILADEQSAREKQFNLLLNQDPGTSLKYPDTLEALNAELLPVTTFDGHPQAVLLDQRSKIADAVIETTNLSRKPVFGIGLQYTPLYRRKNAAFELPPNTGRDMIMPMATVSIPIWQKKYDAAVREQQISQDQFAQQKEALYQTLRQSDEELGFQQQKTLANLRKRDRQYQTTRQILDLLMVEYANGSGTMEELLRVEQQLLNYRLEQIELKLNYHQMEAKREMLHGNRAYNY